MQSPAVQDHDKLPDHAQANMNPASQIVSTGLPEMSVSGRSGTLPFDQPNNAEDDSLGPQFEEKQTASHEDDVQAFPLQLEPPTVEDDVQPVSPQPDPATESQSDPDDAPFSFPEPFEPDPDSGYHKLDFLPLQLRTWFLVLSSIFFAICLGTVVVLLIISKRGERLFQPKNTSYYTIVRYLPTFIGTITQIVATTIFKTLARITPYISLASDRNGRIGTHSRRALTTQYFTFAGVLWQVSIVFSNRHLLLFFGYCTRPFVVFLPAATSAYFIPFGQSGRVPVDLGTIIQPGAVTIDSKTTHSQDAGNSTNKWLVDESDLSIKVSSLYSYYLLGCYCMLLVHTIVLAFHLRNRKTGLKWDPISIADEMQLFHGSHLLYCFQDTESYTSLKELKDHFRNVYLRLGYWRAEDGGIRHGIDLVDGDPGSSGQCSLTDEFFFGSRSGSQTQEHCQSNLASLLREARSREVARHRFRRGSTTDHLPTILYPLIITGMVLIGVLVYLLSLRGTDSQGQSINGWRLTIWAFDSMKPDRVLQLTLLVYRLAPVYIAALFSSCLINLEIEYRCLQPYAAMYREGGGPPEETILLSYPHHIPLLVTVEAIFKNHYKLAAVSFMALLSIPTPIFASGILSATTIYTIDDERKILAIEAYEIFTGSRRDIYLLIVYLALAVLLGSCLLKFNRNSRALPFYPFSLAHFISLCYGSSAISDKEVFEIRDHKDDKQQHLYARVTLRKKKYAFGLYRSNEYGEYKNRLGFDYAENVARVRFRDRPTRDLEAPTESGEAPSNTAALTASALAFAAIGGAVPAAEQNTPGAEDDEAQDA